MKPIASKFMAWAGIMAVTLLPLATSAADRQHDQEDHRGQDSGISGQAVISPTVRLDGVILGGSPVQTSVAVYTAKGRFIGSFDTDAEGHFEVWLRPGNYVLIPYGLSNPFLIPVHTMVTVAKKGVTVVTVGYYDPPI
jgi:hypothetical protein